VKTPVENRLVFPHSALNKALAMNLSFPPVLPMRSAKTMMEHASMPRPKLKTAKVKFPPANAYCWHPESGLARLCGLPPEGPFAVFRDEDRGDWYVWWSDAGTERIVSRKPTKEEIEPELHRLAEQWRAASLRRVYFIGAECRIGEPVKIGIAFDAARRLRALQTAHPKPLKLLAQMPGDLDEERRLHRRFSRCRLGGEWFRITPALKRVIEGIAA
jgi:hypothetical protein